MFVGGGAKGLLCYYCLLVLYSILCIIIVCSRVGWYYSLLESTTKVCINDTEQNEDHRCTPLDDAKLYVCIFRGLKIDSRYNKWRI